jgi:hypothetical protein
MRADNTKHLLAAAQQRSDDARHRAEHALEQLIANRQPLTVAGLARAARVSRSWLYTQPDLLDQLVAIDGGPGHWWGVSCGWLSVVGRMRWLAAAFNPLLRQFGAGTAGRCSTARPTVGTTTPGTTCPRRYGRRASCLLAR